jgi:hypothetical protein
LESWDQNNSIEKKIENNHKTNIKKKYKMIRSYKTESLTNQVSKDKIIKILIIEKHPKK